MQSASDTPRASLRDRSMATAFLALCLLPLVLAPGPSLFGEGWPLPDARETAKEENRFPSEWPALPSDAETLAAWPAAVEAWFQDQLALRDLFIRLHSAIRVFLLNSSPSEFVHIGKEGWVYRGGAEYLDAYRRVDPFTFEELERWRLHLESKRKWCRANGMRYLFCMPPNKSSIYPELLPERFNQLPRPSRLDQLVEHLAEHTDLEILDLRPALLEAREEELVYFPLGLHWNDAGAYAGYLALVERLSEWFPGLEPIPRSELEEVDDLKGGDNLARRLHLGDWLTQEAKLLVYRDQERLDAFTILRRRHYGVSHGVTSVQFTHPTLVDGPRCVILRDSFANRMAPFLANHFSRLAMYFSSLDERRDDFAIERQILLEERPDVVIDQIVEQALARPAPKRRPWPLD